MNDTQNNVFNMDGTPYMQPKITIKDTTEVICEACKGNVFQEATLLRSVSPLISGQPKTSYIPIQVFSCVNCGVVNQEFIPDEVKSSIVSR